MITNPNTLGIFESEIIEIQKIVHKAGALLYYDGANMNAIMGKTRPGDMGFDIVHRIPDDAPDARNYYLIVEAVDARGRAHALEIASEEDRKVARVETWGVRVPEEEFNRIAADKQDDQIIQNADIGRKPKGALAPAYDVATAGGAILEW